MKHSILSILCVITALMFFTSCKKDTPVVDQTTNLSAHQIQAASLKNHPVPFKGDYITVAEFLPTPARQRITGTGTATHLGRNIFVADATVNLTTPPPFAIAGTAVFTAANGDKFYTRFTGFNTPTGAGTSRGDLNHIITGGTGRFENVSGQFTGVAFVTQGSPTNTVTFDGIINY